MVQINIDDILYNTAMIIQNISHYELTKGTPYHALWANCRVSIVSCISRTKILWYNETGLYKLFGMTWWHHQMESFSVLLAICAGNSPVTGEFPSQRPVTRNFDVFFDLCLNKLLSKQLWGWWFETASCPLRHHSNENSYSVGCL